VKVFRRFSAMGFRAKRGSKYEACQQFLSARFPQSQRHSVYATTEFSLSWYDGVESQDAGWVLT